MANIGCPLKVRRTSLYLFSSLSWPSKTLTHWLPSSPAWSVLAPQIAFHRESRVGDVLWPHWLRLLLLPPTRDPSCLGFLSFSWPKNSVYHQMAFASHWVKLDQMFIDRNTWHNSTDDGLFYISMLATKSPVVSDPASGELENVLAAGIKSYE